MHQSKSASSQIFGECHLVPKPGGLVMVGFPSSRKGALLGNVQSVWHGANAFELQKVLGFLHERFGLMDSVVFCFFLNTDSRSFCGNSFTQLMKPYVAPFFWNFQAI